MDTLYTAFPFFVSVNPTWLGQLLEPLLEYQASSQYELPYAALDLGKRSYEIWAEGNTHTLLGQMYPNATGNNQAHNQGLDRK